MTNKRQLSFYAEPDVNQILEDLPGGYPKTKFINDAIRYFNEKWEGKEPESELSKFADFLSEPDWNEEIKANLDINKLVKLIRYFETSKGEKK